VSAKRVQGNTQVGLLKLDHCVPLEIEIWNLLVLNLFEVAALNEVADLASFKVQFHSDRSFC